MTQNVAEKIGMLGMLGACASVLLAITVTLFAPPAWFGLAMVPLMICATIMLIGFGMAVIVGD